MDGRRTLALFLLLGNLALAANSTTDPKNILFISIDDLRPELGCYGSTVQSPNIDALANKSLLFEKAYCQVAQCAPSRASLLTGRRPDTNRVWTIDRNEYWRNPGYTNATTLPQYFKENGFISIGMGKIFHPGPQSGHDDHLYSWSPEGLPYYESPDQTSQNQNMTSLWWAFEGYTGSELPDGQIASQAITVLKDLKTKQTQGETRPFFLAVGFHKPHIPFYMPKKFYDLYPPASQIPLPANPDPPIDMPYIAWTGFGTIRQYDNTKNVFTGTRCNMDAMEAISSACNFPDGYKQEIRKSYYACVSYIDSLVGQVLAELNNQGFADNTIVVLTSDHGFHLGEHGEWEKNTNFEDATRVPLLVHVPNVTISATRTSAFVELIDLFPTLTELAGLPIPSTCPTNSTSLLVCVEGTSFASIIAQPDQTWKNATFSQFARPSAGLTDIPGKGSLDRSQGQEQVMGYSIRTEQYRYTEWVKFDATTATPDWNDLWGVELYDHRTDAELFNNENRNLASNTSFAAVRSALSAAVRAGWKASIPIAAQPGTSISPPSATPHPPSATPQSQTTAETTSTTKGGSSLGAQLKPSMLIICCVVILLSSCL